MQKIFLLIICVAVLLSACAKTPEKIESDSEKNIIISEDKSDKRIKLAPEINELYNAGFILNKIYVTKNMVFDDGKGNKVRLNNSNGQYIAVEIEIINIGNTALDIGYIIEVSAECNDKNTYYAEYYSSDTGETNLAIEPGEKKNITCLISIPDNADYNIIKFKSQDKEYIYEKKNV